MANLSRAKRLDGIMRDLESNITSAVDDAAMEVEELKAEIENWRDGLEGTNLENSAKFSELEDCIDSLESLVSDIQDLSSNTPSADVSFPGMY